MGRMLASAGLLAIMRAVGMAAGFLVTVVLARTLGAEALGFYGYAVIVLALASIPVTQGWGTLLLRTVAHGQAAGSWAPAAGLVRFATAVAAALSVLLLVGGLAAAALRPPWWPGLLGLPLVAALAAVFFLDQLTGLRLAVLRGIGRPVWGQSPETLVRPVTIVLVFSALAALFPPPSLDDAFLALLAASALSALVGAAVLRAKAPRGLATATPAYEARRWSASAAAIACNAGLAALVTQLDILLLGMLGTFEQVGIYRVAMQIGLLGGFVYAALNFLAMDRFARFLAEGRIGEVRRTAVLLSRVALLGALPLPVLFALCGEDILGGVFGPEFRAALVPLLLLLGVQVLTAFLGMANGLLMMGGHERRLLAITGVCLAVDAALCLALIPPFGATGAAFASLVAVGGLRVAIWMAAYRTLGVDTSVMGLPAPGGRPGGGGGRRRN